VGGADRIALVAIEVQILSNSLKNWSERENSPPAPTSRKMRSRSNHLKTLITDGVDGAQKSTIEWDFPNPNHKRELVWSRIGLHFVPSVPFVISTETLSLNRQSGL
jgi:hypothetical protein